MDNDGLNDVNDDDHAEEQALAHLVQIKHNRKLLAGRNRPQKSHRPLVEVLSEGLYGKDSEEEVGDDWFGEDHEEARKGMVRLNIGRGKDKVEGGIRRLGRIVGRSMDDGKKDARGREAVPMVTLDEALDDGEEPAASAPIYSGLSLVESPTHSNESLLYASDSTTTYEDNSSTPTFSALALPTPSPAPASSSSSTTSTTPTRSTTPLGPKVARTITLSSLQPALPSKRRDHRSDFTPRRKLGTLRPKDLQKVLARRRRKFRRGEVEVVDAEGVSELELALVEAGAVLEDEEEQFSVDVLYEHQRGLIVFGLPRFSSAALAQFDPAPWTDASLKNSAFTPHDHPLPTPFWTWEDDHWMVDMGHDVDEQGWSYALRFHSSHWRGEPDPWRSFVRRRRWVRTRSYRPSLSHSPSSHPSCEINWDALQASALVDRGQTEEGPPVGLRAATAVLPLDSKRKDEVFGWSTEIDAKDPFLAWSFVKTEGEGVIARLKTERAKGSRSEEELWGVWRDAVVEVNLRKVARVMRECRLDREKLGLWRWWLGAQETEQEESEQNWAEKARQLSPNGRAGEGVDARLWREKGEKRPVLDDVWDLLEGRLDHILQLFEFQLTRLDLLRLVLALHPLKHSHHKYESFDRGHPFQPDVLSPNGIGSRLGRRLDFYRDVAELEKFYEGKVGEEKGGEAKEKEEQRRRKGKGKSLVVVA